MPGDMASQSQHLGRRSIYRGPVNGDGANGDAGKTGRPSGRPTGRQAGRPTGRPAGRPIGPICSVPNVPTNIHIYRYKYRYIYRYIYRAIAHSETTWPNNADCSILSVAFVVHAHWHQSKHSRSYWQLYRHMHRPVYVSCNFAFVIQHNLRVVGEGRVGVALHLFSQMPRQVRLIVALQSKAASAPASKMWQPAAQS